MVSNKQNILFKSNLDKPYIIAGPCMAESEELMHQVAEVMHGLSAKLGFQYIFKASFDKANRTSASSYRGPGLEKALLWFENIKRKFKIPVLSDVHETAQISTVAEVLDVLQIPAFLCRQTDLIVAAVESGCAVNVKKGQFLAPSSTRHIANKIREAAESKKISANFAITERGTSFGYGDLVVDMRGFATMNHVCAAPVIFDITHSTQQPGAGGSQGEVSGGMRQFAPLLARSAAASGYVDGFFLEVHPKPAEAKSDAAVQLNILQATVLLEQIIPLWKASRELSLVDKNFIA